MDTPTLDALAAQTVAYVSANYQTGDEHGEVVVDALRVVLGEPGNYGDPRRSFMGTAHGELLEILAAGQEAGWRTIWDFKDNVGDVGWAVAMAATFVTDKGMMKRAVAPDDAAWHLVAGYLQNIEGGATQSWEDFDLMEYELDEFVFDELSGDGE